MKQLCLRAWRALAGLLVLGCSLTSASAQDVGRVEAIPAREVVALAAGGEALYAATFTQVYISPDGGEAWQPAAALPVGTHDVQTLYAHEDALYAGTLGSGVYVSRDGGASWTALSGGLTGLARRILAFTARGDSLYAGTDAGVYVLSLRQPTGWEGFNEGFGASSVRALSTSGRTLVASAGISGQVLVRASGASTWKSVPLDPQPQPLAQTFLRSGAFLLAGTTNGIYRSPQGAEGWQPVRSFLPPGSDVVALAAHGARVYAGVRHQGYTVYASDDHGATWTLQSQAPTHVFALLGSGRRLWVGRGDGLWYHDLAASTPLYQASLVEDEHGWPVSKGGALATLEGNELHLTIFFSGFRFPWGQVDLYRGDPEAGGEYIENLALTVPTSSNRGGGVEAVVPLTEAQVLDLNQGRLYLHVRMVTGDPAHNLSGQIQVLPIMEPRVVGTRLSQIWQGLPVARGNVLATLEGRQLRLAGFFSGLGAPWARIDLLRGAVGAPGEPVENLLINFAAIPETGVGFDRSLTLTDDQAQDLLDGLLYVEVQTLQPREGVRGQLLAHPNRAPDASRVLTPPDGATIVIGGTGGADPVDPETPLATVSFAPADDPDGNRVAYLWQVSTRPDFSGPGPTVTFDLGADSTRIPLTVADVAALFDTLSGRQPGAILLDTPMTVYHRVLTTDGARYAVGEAVKATFLRGTITANDPVEDVPGVFALHGNYPNPFNPSTTITFDLPAQAEVRVEVFNLLGQRVLVVPVGTVAAGSLRSVEVDAATLSSGSYLYRVIAQGERTAQVATGKMMLVK